MTSIYDIPYNDIKVFLKANNKIYENENEDDAYNKALELLKDKKAIGHTINIIEWMMAHNLLLRNISIHNYTTSEINKMSQIEINKLAKLLKMNGNNIENVTNILRYLRKLDNKSTILLPETNDIIFGLLNELEMKDFVFDVLTPNEFLNLLRKHYNKALIRKLIYQNMEKIIFYNFLPNFRITKLDDLWYFRDLAYDLPISIVLKLVEINEEKLVNDYSIEERNQLLDELDEMKENGFGSDILNIYTGISSLTNFFTDLIKINEIGLAKKVFDIVNKYNFMGQIALTVYSFNDYLINNLFYQRDIDLNIFDKALEFIGESNFIISFEEMFTSLRAEYIKQFLYKLIKLKRYELIIKIMDTLIIKNYKGSNKELKDILPYIIRAIELENDNLIARYLDVFDILSITSNKIRSMRLNNIINEVK